MKLKAIHLLAEAKHPAADVAATKVAPLIAKIDGIEEIGKRGADAAKTGFYQLRVKPTGAEDSSALLKKIEAAVKQAGFTSVKVNAKSPNSSKFQSVSFVVDGQQLDIVLAKGANEGEAFEKDLLTSLKELLAGKPSELAISAVQALEAVDSALKLENIKSFEARSGSTVRQGSADSGAVIGDIIVKLKNGEERFISVKNENGATITNFGVAGAFGNDLTVKTETAEWKAWFAPLKIDAKKLQDGLQARRDGTKITWELEENPNTQVPKAIIAKLHDAFGTGYIYLRQKGNGFSAVNVTDELLTKLFNGLKVTNISYPGITKQLSLILSNEPLKLKIEVRNPSGGDALKPKDLKVKILNSPGFK